jgi:hypothetical protein
MDMHQVRRDDAISFLKDTFSRKFLGIEIIPVTGSEMKCIIN